MRGGLFQKAQVGSAKRDELVMALTVTVTVWSLRCPDKRAYKCTMAEQTLCASFADL